MTRNDTIVTFISLKPKYQECNMINVIDEVLDSCQRALLVLNAYERQKESGSLTANDEALSIRMIAENLNGAIDKLKITEPYKQYIPAKNEIANQNSFAGRLKFALKEQGMTQAELAESVGVSQSAISALATGKTGCNSARVGAIARALDISALWLVDGEGEIYSVDFSQ